MSLLWYVHACACELSIHQLSACVLAKALVHRLVSLQRVSYLRTGRWLQVCAAQKATRQSPGICTCCGPRVQSTESPWQHSCTCTSCTMPVSGQQHHWHPLLHHGTPAGMCLFPVLPTVHCTLQYCSACASLMNFCELPQSLSPFKGFLVSSVWRVDHSRLTFQ